MSESSARNLWIPNDGGIPARELLHRTVTELTRARRLQLIVDHAFAGLAAGLGLATLAVLSSRLLSWPQAPWQLAAAAVLGSVTIALLLGWWRRPDSVEVAIRADLKLRQKQRLSTAWEYVNVHGDDELADRLALQAVKAKLPANAWTVFPVRVNRWGQLAPLAATALLLAGIIDLEGVQPPASRARDAQVIREGERLGAFGREMQARAQRDKLPRSEQQAAELERLGARMESGTLARSETLGQLRQLGEALERERMRALAEASPGGGTQRAQGSPVASDLKPGAMLERLQRGALDSNDTRALTQRLGDLERSGIPRREMENALARQKAGADEALREILEKLAKLERALKEDRELKNAREQVLRARDNLGEPRAANDAGRTAGANIDWDDDEGKDRGADSDASSGSDPRLTSSGAGRAARAASQGDSSVATERLDTATAPPAPNSPVLAPQGQARAGEEYSSQGKILPRVGRPSVENVEMKPEFAAQMEAVLSREHYPAHFKEFIRRYFLSLSRSENARGAAQPAPPPPEAP
jgi:hypothetical protein